MAIRYKVYLGGEENIEVEAEKIHPGITRLWFYDAQDNLQAVFRWENIRGFSAIDSVSGQIIVDELLHEKNKFERFEKTHGPVIAAIERVHQGLQSIEREAMAASSEIYETKKNAHDSSRLVSRYGETIRKARTQLTDDQQNLMSKLDLLVEQINSLLDQN